MDLKSIVLPPPRPGSATELSNTHISPGPLRPYSANALPSITTAPGAWKTSLPPSPVHSPSNGQPKEEGTVLAAPVAESLRTETPSLPPTLNRKSSTNNFKVAKSPPKSLRKAKSMAALGSTLSSYPPPMPDYEYDDEPASPTAIKTEQLEPATPSIPIISTLPSSTSVSSRRHAHILSEQRRRENINGGFQQLRNSVPYCRGTQLSKAVILKKAVEYIAALEEEVYNLRYRPQQHAPPPHPQHTPQHAQHAPPPHTHQHPPPPPHMMHHQNMHLGPTGPPMHMPVYSSPSPYSYRQGSHSASHLPQPQHVVPERPASAEGSPYARRASHDVRSLRSSSTTSLGEDKLPPVNV